MVGQPEVRKRWGNWCSAQDIQVTCFFTRCLLKGGGISRIWGWSFQPPDVKKSFIQHLCRPFQGWWSQPILRKLSRTLQGYPSCKNTFFFSDQKMKTQLSSIHLYPFSLNFINGPKWGLMESLVWLHDGNRHLFSMKLTHFPTITKHFPIVE